MLHQGFASLQDICRCSHKICYQVQSFTTWWWHSIQSSFDQRVLALVWLVPPQLPAPAQRHSEPSEWRSPCGWWPRNPLFRSGIAPWRRPACWISQHCAWWRKSSDCILELSDCYMQWRTPTVQICLLSMATLWSNTPKGRLSHSAWLRILKIIIATNQNH